MAKNSIDTYGAAGKTNLLYFDPDCLHLVTDKAHVLYDERVHSQPNERMVRSIMHKGVTTAIIIAKDPETGRTCVVDGRQRVINAREANRRLIERGEEPIQVPGVVRKFGGSGADLADVMVLTNELREQDTPLNRAKKMQRLSELGRDEEAIGLVFGCTVQTVRSTLALLDCTAAVRDAVEAGKVKLSDAVKLGRLGPEEQRAKVADLVQAGEGAKPHERSRKQREVMGDAVPKMRGRKEVTARRDDFSVGSAERALLDWVLGLA